MRSCVPAAVLAAVFVVAPAAAGFAPASAQDFSITNPESSIHIEGAQLGADWIKKLQAWWDLHAYYPKEAAAKNEAGTVKLHLLIHANGEVWLVKVADSSGSHALDNAALWTFHGMLLQPFPPGVPAPEADVTISLHYVLTDQPAKGPFTVTNAPVKDAVVATMLQRTCTGIVSHGGWGPSHFAGFHEWVEVVFYHRPDGAAWIDFYPGQHGHIQGPVTELGVSAQWNDLPRSIGAGAKIIPHYAVWPAGGSRLTGMVTDAGPGLEAEGSIELTCEAQTVPQIQKNRLAEGQ